MALVCFYFISCAELWLLLFYILNEILTFFGIKNKFRLSAIFLYYLVKSKISSSKLHNSVSLNDRFFPRINTFRALFIMYIVWAFSTEHQGGVLGVKSPFWNFFNLLGFLRKKIPNQTLIFPSIQKNIKISGYVPAEHASNLI